MRTPMTGEETPWGGRKGRFKNPDSKIWLDRMAAKGWTAPTWPKAYGGGGLTREEAKVLDQEMARIKARPALFSFGIWMLGPVLLEYAGHYQRRNALVPGLFRAGRWL
jgi:alkylation response protein AidB-like acyl-CoA dehydrogenase